MLVKFPSDCNASFTQTIEPRNDPDLRPYKIIIRDFSLKQ